MGFTHEQAVAAGKIRAQAFTTEYQRAGYNALVAKYGKAAAQRILAESVSKRPATQPELDLYGILAGMGVDFHTSYIVELTDAAYTVDAYIETARLIIQVDGEYWHDMPDRRDRDQRVDGKMRKAGYRVMRFDAGDVQNDPAKVHAAIETALVSKA